MLFRKINLIYAWGVSHIGWLHHPASLVGRLYVANVFFASGLQKVKDWDTTLFLFQEEYLVPLLSPSLAAFLGTAGEIVLPVLVVFGIATRFAALGLSIVNAVAVLSLAEVAPAALYLHGIWALILAQITLYGSGWFSVDAYLKLEYSQTQPQSKAV